MAFGQNNQAGRSGRQPGTGKVSQQAGRSLDAVGETVVQLVSELRVN
jgi:hypothetical protein